MITDPELEQWSELFRSEQIESADIVARANKALRRFRLWIYAEVAVTAGAIAFAVWMNNNKLTMLVVVSIVAAWLFRLMNDWNDFTGVATATGSYLSTLLRRLRSNLRAAEFGGVFYFVLISILSSFVFREAKMPLSAYLLLPMNIVYGIATVAFYVWLFFYRRKLRKEIDQLESLKMELGDGPVKSSPNYFADLVAHATTSLAKFRRKLRVY